MLTQHKRWFVIIIAVTFLLMIPLIAMQFTPEVDWSVMDFVIMGILLLSTGFGCDLVIRNVKMVGKRVVYIGLCLFAFFLIWVELAVGIFH